MSTPEQRAVHTKSVHEATLQRFRERIPWAIYSLDDEAVAEIVDLPWRKELAAIVMPSAESFDREVGKGTLSNFFQSNYHGPSQEKGVAGFFRFQGAVIGIYVQPEVSGQRDLNYDRGYRK